MKLGNRFTILTTNKHTQCFPNEEYKWKILLIINNMNIVEYYLQLSNSIFVYLFGNDIT